MGTIGPCPVTAVGSPAACVAGLSVTRARVVGAVAVGVVGERALVADRVPAASGVDGGGDGDRHRCRRPAIAPFQVTVLVPTFGARCREVAVALTRVRLAGRTSVNSLPGLSALGGRPVLVRVTV